MEHSPILKTEAPQPAKEFPAFYGTQTYIQRRAKGTSLS